jgi:hypothetical protein
MQQLIWILHKTKESRLELRHALRLDRGVEARVCMDAVVIKVTGAPLILNRTFAILQCPSPVVLLRRLYRHRAPSFAHP